MLRPDNAITCAMIGKNRGQNTLIALILVRITFPLQSALIVRPLLLKLSNISPVRGTKLQLVRKKPSLNRAINHQLLIQFRSINNLLKHNSWPNLASLWNNPRSTNRQYRSFYLNNRIGYRPDFPGMVTIKLQFKRERQ